MLYLLTPTGARPDAFAICQKLMRRQTYRGAVRWVIVDDGPEPSALAPMRKGWERIVLRPTPYWQEGENTQARNLLAGLDYIERVDRDPLVVVIEDDDYYRPTWLARIARELQKAELVGEGFAIYYNATTGRFQEMNNRDHCSLRSSAMRGEALKTFREVMATPCKYYDLLLWRKHADQHIFKTRLTVGIKGLPGRYGIAPGHAGLKGQFDEQGKKLDKLIGEDSKLYKPFRMGVDMDREKFIVIKKPLKYGRKLYQVGEEFTPDKKRHAEILILAKKIRRVVDAPAQKTAKAKPKKAAAKKKTATKNKPPAKSNAEGEASSKPEASPEAETPPEAETKPAETHNED